MALFVETGIELGGIQAGLGGQFFDRRAHVAAEPDGVLIFEEEVVEVPEAALVGGAFGGLVGLVRVVTMVKHRGKDDTKPAGFDIVFPNDRFRA